MSSKTYVKGLRGVQEREIKYLEGGDGSLVPLRLLRVLILTDPRFWMTEEAREREKISIKPPFR